jgi:hypothetical protein
MAYQRIGVTGDSDMPGRETDMLDRPEPTGQPMHARDRRFWVVLGIWAAIAVGAFGTGINAFSSGSPHWGFGLSVVGLVGAVVATLHLLETRRIAPRQSHVSAVMVLVAGVTWAFISWQTWMWFHAPGEPVQGYTKTQLGDAVAKAKDAQLAQDNKDIESLRQSIPKQIADAVAKATAPLQAQIGQLQSDAPVSVDKFPTSLKVLLKGSDFDVIGDTRNVFVTTSLILYRQRQALLTTQAYPGLAILIIFKKPILYTEGLTDDHGVGIPTPELASKNPRFAVLAFDSVFYSGLLEITFK